MSYSIEPRTRKYDKRYGFLSLAGSIQRIWEKILDAPAIIGLDAAKTASKS